MSRFLLTKKPVKMVQLKTIKMVKENNGVKPVVLLTQDVTTYPNTYGVWGKLSRGDPVVLTHFYQVWAIREHQLHINLKGEDGFLVRLGKTHRMKSFPDLPHQEWGTGGNGCRFFFWP